MLATLMGQKVNLFSKKNSTSHVGSISPFNKEVFSFFISFSIIPPPHPLKTLVLYDVTRIAWRAGVILASELPGDFVEKIIAAFFDFFSSGRLGRERNLYQGGE